MPMTYFLMLYYQQQPAHWSPVYWYDSVGRGYWSPVYCYDSVGRGLTRRTLVEDVVVDFVAGAAKADADSVFDVLEKIVIDFGVE